MQHNPILFCIVGPAGSGKTSLTKKLLEAPELKLKKIVSATTRAPRPGEQDGINYIFLTPENFKKAVANGEFFEWEEIHGNCYGQLKSSLVQALVGTEDVVFDIDIRGAKSIKSAYPESTVVIFLLPPSLETIRQRILARAPTSEEELSRRLNTAKEELKSFYQFYSSKTIIDYALVNEDFDFALKQLQSIVDSERLSLSRRKPESLNFILDQNEK